MYCGKSGRLTFTFPAEEMSCQKTEQMLADLSVHSSPCDIYACNRLEISSRSCAGTVRSTSTRALRPGRALLLRNAICLYAWRKDAVLWPRDLFKQHRNIRMVEYQLFYGKFVLCRSQAGSLLSEQIPRPAPNPLRLTLVHDLPYSADAEPIRSKTTHALASDCAEPTRGIPLPSARSSLLSLLEPLCN